MCFINENNKTHFKINKGINIYMPLLFIFLSKAFSIAVFLKN